jgi:hypothetical protein
MTAKRPVRLGIVLTAVVGLAALARLGLYWVTTKDERPITLTSASIDATLGLLPAEDAAFVRKTVALRFRAPEREARRATDRRDYKLVAVAGLGVFFPGTPDHRDPQYYAKRYGTKEILGAGDAGNSYMELYQTESYNYALRYNLVVLRVLGEAIERRG